MRLPHALSLLTLPILSLLPLLTLAQSNFPNQTGPFNLLLTSTNSTLNSTLLGACHSGAALESLCVLPSSSRPTSPSDPFYSFYLNTTTLTTPPTSILTWNLIGSSFVESEALSFIYSPTSNVALPLLYPDPEQAQEIQIDPTTGEIGVPETVDDTVVPPMFVEPTEGGGYPSVYRWFVCETYFGGYTYDTLAWRMGAVDVPQNPSCQAVGLFRREIEGTAPAYPPRGRKMRRGREVRWG